MEFPDPCVWFLFPGQRLGASITCPLHSGDDQCCSLHDHCEWKDMICWALVHHSPIVSFWTHVTHLIQLNIKDITTGTCSHNPISLREILWLYAACEKSDVTDSQADWSFIFLTGDFAFLQKPLHPCISQLLAGQTLFGEHDSEWRTISLSIISITFIYTSMYFCWHALPAISVYLLFLPSQNSWAHTLGLLLKLFTFPASIYPQSLLHIF